MMMRRRRLRWSSLILTFFICFAISTAIRIIIFPQERVRQTIQVVSTPLATSPFQVASSPSPATSNHTSTPIPTPVPSPTPYIAPPPLIVENEMSPPSNDTVVLRAVGDLMQHLPQAQSAKTQDGYDYSEYFAHVQKFLISADITLANLETPITTRKPTGYPAFNAPPEYLDAVASTGVDFLTLANNHVLDKGLDGLSQTIDQVKAKGMTAIGASPQNLERVTMKDVKGIKMAFVAYAQFVNVVADPNVVSMLSEQQVIDDVAQARSMGADIIVAYLHWGDEGVLKPPKIIQWWAQRIADLGVDLIIASHPHVLQPVEMLSTRDGRQVVCAYSLGNFVSDMRIFPKNVGAILEVRIARVHGKAFVRQVGVVPTFVARYKGKALYKYEVLPAQLYTSKGYSAGSTSASKFQDALRVALDTLGKTVACRVRNEDLT